MDLTRAADTFTSMLHAIDAKDWDGGAGRSPTASRWTTVRYSGRRRNGRRGSAGCRLARVRVGIRRHATHHRTAGGHSHVQRSHSGYARPRLSSDSGRARRRHMDGRRHYTVQLVPDASTWKIAAITLIVFYQEGNTAIPDLARARAANGAGRTASPKETDRRAGGTQR